MAVVPEDLKQQLQEAVEWLAQQFCVDGGFDLHEWESLEFFAKQLRTQHEESSTSLALLSLVQLWRKLAVVDVDRLVEYDDAQWQQVLDNPSLPDPLVRHVLAQQSVCILRKADTIDTALRKRMKKRLELVKERDIKAYNACKELIKYDENDMREILAEKPFSLQYFVTKVNSCFARSGTSRGLLQCPEIMLGYKDYIDKKSGHVRQGPRYQHGHENPTTGIVLDDKPEGKKENATGQWNRSSENHRLSGLRKRLFVSLSALRGTDPLQEIRAQAAGAKRPADGSLLYERKKSARSEKFEDSDDGEGQDPVRLSGIPGHKAFSVRLGRTAGKGRHDDDGKLRNIGQRRPFTQEEKDAIKEGVERLGFGNWARIKAAYAIVLRNRTSVNIKDCYRTMERKGEVPQKPSNEQTIPKTDEQVV